MIAVGDLGSVGPYAGIKAVSHDSTTVSCRKDTTECKDQHFRRMSER